MKLLYAAPFAALAAAFVLPDEQVLGQLVIEDRHRGHSWFGDATDAAHRVSKEADSIVEDIKESMSRVGEYVGKNTVQAFDQAIEYTTKQTESVRDSAYNVKAWVESAADDWFVQEGPHDGHPPHHDHPHPPPHEGRPPHHGPGHDHPPPHHEKPNRTVYEIINESKYTTKLAKLINQYDDLVKHLNSTKANYTLFAPIDAAFDKIPKKAPKPSKEQLKALLSYHVVPDLYSAKRVLFSNTAPTLLEADHLADKPKPQRIAFKLTLRGLTVNFYSRIIGVNFFATNGVVHGIDSILLPPPSVIQLIDLLPGEFSTLELGLTKTGLLDTLNTTDHAGGTLFAPSNSAFQKLGPRINAFLFSSHGLKYLEALLKYHVVPDFTLYSDAYYKNSKKDNTVSVEEEIPSGKFHFDLPTLLDEHNLSVDLVRYAGFSSFHINGFSRISVADGIARDGVIHLVGNVLIPPKRLGGQSGEGEEITVEDLKDRLLPFMTKTDL